MKYWFLLSALLGFAFTPYHQIIDGRYIRQGQDYALFFANNDYSSNADFGNLKNPIKDARAIAIELKEMYDFETKVYENKTRTEIYQVLEQWQKRSFAKDDQLFIFFSGHGTFWEFTKKGYFVPQTSSTDYSSYIELTDLGNIITQIPCRHILMAVDACYSGTIDQEIAFKGRNFSRPKQNVTTERDNLIFRQLRNQSRLLITSGGKQRTPDGKDHSPFSNAILKGLRAAYTYGDGLMTYTDLLGELERVSPTPHQGELSQHEQGGFVFVSKGSNTATVIPDNMVFVQGGSFQMGSNDKDAESNETPHRVMVSDYYIGRFEVTFEEYDAYCEATGKEKPDDEGWGRGQRPVINVSWHDAVAYCNWLSEKHGYQKVYTGSGDNVTVNWNANGYRLPTEAEWEYAARSRGRAEKYAGTSNEESLSSYANFCDNNCDRSWKIGDQNDGYPNTAPVGSLRANGLGLHDMSGNVWEWCWDWYGSDYYGKSPEHNPSGPDTGSYRVIRGGSWHYSPLHCRSAFRGYYGPSFRFPYLGFRLARSAGK